jgi:hypothetical protein
MPEFGGLRYQQNTQNTSSQVPVDKFSTGGTGRFSYAGCPVNEVISKRPSYVTVNKIGTYAFAYDSASAALGTSTTNYITGSVVQNAGAGGIRLDINPLAWRRCDAADVIGDITFVYVRVG